MSIAPQHTALMQYLKREDHEDLYHSKVLELREVVQKWLAYIPQSFPHYTLHTVEHSDEIVLQLSKLLFKDDDPAQPVIRLSPIEVYILVVAAYLHDSGMVVSDKEKAEILASEAWKSWIEAEPNRAKRWHDIEELRKTGDPRNETERHFQADRQMRFLIAEYFRRTHHLRAAHVMKQHQYALGRFALDDPMLLRTISNVCIGHGLTEQQLEDRERYPDEADIRGHKANTRLLAILLRIGDLLDMSVDRACPLLLNAANTLPADSFARWTKYQRITHRLTTPDSIRLIAECMNQEEHRFLQDWCQWLVNEVTHARIVMSRSARHKGWEPPVATLEGADRTISIRPHTDATYTRSYMESCSNGLQVYLMRRPNRVGRLQYWTTIQQASLAMILKSYRRDIER